MRNGLSPTRWAVPAGAEPAIALDALAARFPALLDPAATPLPERFARGEIVRADRRPWSASDLAGPTDELWFQRELRPEHVPDAPLPNLLQDDHLLVIDKPHDVATMPRGAHVLASALVRLRAQTGIESLAPLHRLDRRTAGVLAFGIQPQERAAYQQLFARGEVRKEYRAIVLPGRQPGPGAGQGPGPTADVPVLRAGQTWQMSDRLEKRHGDLQTRIVPGAPNAHTEVIVLEAGPGGGAPALLQLTPRTGRTHQLRAQLAHRGLPIAGDDLYPEIRTIGAEDPPLALLARLLAFTDPITGEAREVRSRRELPGLGSVALS